MKIVLASTNPGKIAEIKMLLRDLPIELIPQNTLGISEIEETGTTFIENAMIKARHAAQQSGLPAMADDSGFSVAALKGAPGVISARYAGLNAKDTDRIQKVLNELRQTNDADRRAYFYCVIALFFDAKEPAPIVTQGIWAGEVLSEPRGHQGFGYDPIFYVPSHRCSAAELDPTEKNRISHRGQAMQQFRLALQQRLK